LDQQAMGTAVIDRFADVPVTGDVATSLEEFKVAHQALVQAGDASNQACRVRDEALEAVGSADALLDEQVLGLAKKLVGADLGSLRNPFAQYIGKAPGEVVKMAYKSEVAAVRDLAARLALKGPPEEITRQIGACLQQAAKVEEAVASLGAPQSDYDCKRALRDEAAAAWSKAFAKLRLRAQLAFENNSARLKALFEAPGAVERPVKRRKKSGKNEKKTSQGEFE
jgi:hypothetical protein